MLKLFLQFLLHREKLVPSGLVFFVSVEETWGKTRRASRLLRGARNTALLKLINHRTTLPFFAVTLHSRPLRTTCDATYTGDLHATRGTPAPPLEEKIRAAIERVLVLLSPHPPRLPESKILRNLGLNKKN